MNFENFNSHILSLIDNNDLQEADKYINDHITELSQEVSNLRERIVSLQDRIEIETNSDEALHMEYDLKDLKESLNKSTENLNKLQELYKKYINK